MSSGSRARGRRPSILLGIYSGMAAMAYGLRREPEIVLWYIGFPLLLLLLAKFVFLGRGPPLLEVGVYAPGSNVYDILEDSGFKPVAMESRDAILDSMSRGDLVVGVVVEDGIEVLYAGKKYRWIAISIAQALALKNTAQPTGGPSFVEAGLEALVEAAGVEVLDVGDPLIGPEGELALYTVNLIGVEALYIALYGGMVAIVNFRRNGTLKILAASPGGARSLLGFLTGYNMVAIIVSTVAIFTASKILGADYSGLALEGWIVAAILILAGLETIFLASIPLSLAIRREETAAAIAGLTGFLVIFVAGLAIPLESLPSWLASIAKAFPMTLAVDLARSSLLGEIGFTDAMAASWPLWLSMLASGAVGIISYRRLIAAAVEE